jgi:type I restriction enzyme R subunit
VDYGKEYFNIIDFTGTATRHFADPDFDGEPARIEEVTIDETASWSRPPPTSPRCSGASRVPGRTEQDEAGRWWRNHHRPPAEPRKFYIDGGEVEVIGHLVYDLDTDGKKLQVVKYTEYSGRAVQPVPHPRGTAIGLGQPDTRAEVLRELTERGISFEELAASSEQPDADPFDLLCHLAWNARCSPAASAPMRPSARPKTCSPSTATPPAKSSRCCSTATSSAASCNSMCCPS